MFDLSTITRAKKKPPITTIYGGAGVGKTTFACGSESPIVIRTEDGLVQDVDTFPLCTSYDHVMQCMVALSENDHKYKTVVVDSLDWLENLIWVHTCERLGVRSIEEPGYGKGYMEAMTYWRFFLNALTNLRNTKGMMPVMICHSEIKTISDPMHPSYDMRTLKLHRRAAALVEEASDIIGYAAMQMNTVEEDGSGFNQKRTRAKTSGMRVLHTAPNPAYLSKTRYPIANPLALDWAAFINELSK